MKSILQLTKKELNEVAEIQGELAKLQDKRTRLDVDNINPAQNGSIRLYLHTQTGGYEDVTICYTRTRDSFVRVAKILVDELTNQIDEKINRLQELGIVVQEEEE